MNTHTTYGVGIDTILSAIRQNRRLVTYWTGKGMAGIAQNHRDNVRDLQIMLLNTRFPNNTMPVAFGSDFVPVVKVTDDNGTDNTPAVSDSDAAAFVAAIADHVESVTGESVNV